MIRQLRVIGIAALALGAASAAHAQQPRMSTSEGGVFLDFGPSYIDYKDIASADQCRMLCIQDARCKVWRYVSGQAPADYGTARRVCVLGDRPVQRRTTPGTWATSGEVK